MKIEKLRHGMTVYDVGTQRMGNTSRTTVSVWTVRILQVDPGHRYVVASWNSGSERMFYPSAVKRWREKMPMLVDTVMGGKRLATRAEQKAAREAAGHGYCNG